MGLVDGDQRADEPAQERSEPRVGEPLGGDVGEGQAAGRELAEAAPHLGGSRVEARYVAAMPRASSARTWSCMSEMSGEMTSVVPPSSVAGSW